MPHDGLPEQGAVTYPLRIWRQTFAFRSKDHGISPTPTALEFPENGTLKSIDYTRIAGINLMVTHLRHNAKIVQMLISFRDEPTIRVQNSGPYGQPDPGLVPVWQDFAADLHARLVAGGHHEGIAFLRGFSETRQKFVRAVMIVASAFFILMPIILFIVTAEPRALLALVGGIFFLVPAFRSTKANESGTYDPREAAEVITKIAEG